MVVSYGGPCSKACGKGSALSLVRLIVGYIESQNLCRITLETNTMQVSDILRVKGHTLFTVPPHETLAKAMLLMQEQDIGSLVVMDKGRLAGVLTFREVILQINRNGGQVGITQVAEAMDASPLVCSSDTDMDAVRRMMLERHARYMPVMDGTLLMGVISFYDVAKAVVDAQNFENKMLKAYIRDWPEKDEA
jgi:CBS domain-containing protein